MTFIIGLLLPEAACFIADRSTVFQAGANIEPVYNLPKFERFNNQTYFISGGDMQASATLSNLVRSEFQEKAIDLRHLEGMRKILKGEIKPIIEMARDDVVKAGFPLTGCNVNCILTGFSSYRKPFLVNLFIGYDWRGSLGDLELRVYDQPAMNVIISPWLEKRTTDDITQKIHVFLDRFLTSPIPDQREGFKHLARELVKIAAWETLFVSPHADVIFIEKDGAEEKFFRLGPVSYFRSLYLIFAKVFSRRKETVENGDIRSGVWYRGK